MIYTLYSIKYTWYIIGVRIMLIKQSPFTTTLPVVWHEKYLMFDSTFRDNKYLTGVNPTEIFWREVVPIIYGLLLYRYSYSGYIITWQLEQL